MLSIIVALSLLCGTERVSVKNLTDPAATKLSPASFSTSTVDALRELSAPAWANQLPRQASEAVVYEVNAVLVGAKLEEDRDLHIVIADSAADAAAGKTMIVEIPHPSCMQGAPAWAVSGVTAARAKFLTLMRVSAAFKKFKTPVPVTLRGVAFFDKLHGQTGVAPDGIELHPVFSLVMR